MRALVALALLPMAVAAAAQSFQIGTSDDIWVYPRAGDPIGDPVMRVWGDGTSSYPDTWPLTDYFSHGYLKFSLAAIPRGRYRIESAVLRLTSGAARYTRAEGDANPLEARTVENRFSEGEWDFNDPTNPLPGNPLYGLGDLSSHSQVDAFPLPIRLDPQSFNAALNAGINGSDRSVAIALTSKMPVTQQGGTPYRIYTKEDGGGRGPVLELRLVKLPTAIAARAVPQ